MSDHQEGCEVAHVVPQSQSSWFNRNQMHSYIDDPRRSTDAVADASNALLLRSDLHFAFDQQKFVFVPKAPSDSGLPELVTHIMVYSREHRQLYHNAKLHSIHGVRKEFLFARFAWTIFPLIQHFLNAEVPRELLSVSLAGAYDISFPASAEQCKQFTLRPGRKSRSQSPTKRVRTEMPEEADDVDHNSLPSMKRARFDSYSPAESHKSGACAHTIEGNLLTPLSSDAQSEFAGCQQDISIQDLKEKYLKSERIKSDPDGTWLEEQEWLNDNRGRPMSPASLDRCLRAMGVEVFDED
jgi:hypothetical protein